jgi:hypothetical protein
LSSTYLGCIAAIFGIFFYITSASAIAVWPHEKSDLKPDPDVVWEKLDNGFRYVLMKNTQPKDRVSMHLNVQAGSLHEKENERGLAHFLEHMLFRGLKILNPENLSSISKASACSSARMPTHIPALMRLFMTSYCPMAIAKVFVMGFLS